ncbi:MAG: Phosphotransferase enzyme family protein [Syntrophorhabdus sp. PtaU1.Bin002]|nr:MAG: Phosphotransferase enzyme family protein [Syntrophorhabdus sp. PtaU1.Bin002]
MIEFARQALGLSESVPIEIAPLAGRGSDRSFFRLTWSHAGSAILVHYDPHRIENTYYGDLTIFLDAIHIPVPRLIGHDRMKCLMLMEDLGDTDLWALKSAPWETRRDLYRKTLTTVHRLHSFPERDFPAEQVKLMEGFGPNLYQWERQYFIDHFVGGVCGISLGPSHRQELEGELAALAERLAETGRSLVHRDLQSQNVMIRKGEPFLIDFQGMRFGSPFYDLGSLLCDPYVAFLEDERDELLSFCYGFWKEKLDWTVFRNCFWEASVQRLMQALGAYGFLGREKGLKSFLHHIPAGLRNLLDAVSRTTSLPRLRELLDGCGNAIQDSKIKL